MDARFTMLDNEIAALALTLWKYRGLGNVPLALPDSDLLGSVRLRQRGTAVGLFQQDNGWTRSCSKAI